MARVSGFASVCNVALLAALIGAHGQRAAARQNNGSAATTLDGVYTAPQAARGEETYMGICVACHPSGTYAGDAFKASWNERPLSDLYDTVIQTMPKQDPGTLSAKEVADLIAYILKQNRLPAGAEELPANPAALRKIIIKLAQ